MWHVLWIPVLIPTLIIKSNCDNNRTHSDVYIQYSGHAEADEADTIPYTTKRTTTTVAPTTKTSTITTTSFKTTVLTVTASNITVPTTVETNAPTTETTTTTATKTTTTTATVKPVKTTTVKMSEEQTDSVIFLPEVRTGRRDDDDGYLDGMKIKDLLMMKPLPEVMNNKFHDEKPVDGQKEDVVFVVGKNGETDTDKKPDTNRNYNSNQVDDYEDQDSKVTSKPRLSCKHLDCSNTINSICGGRIVNRQWKYRLFLNECYMRKVNCGYKYEINRYRPLPRDKCKTVGTHQVERPFSYTPKHYNFDKTETKSVSPGRRGYASRRSMTMNAKGEYCSHPCPVTCPDDYDPECAISATGQKRVFMNHCKLDENSCFYSVVWHRSPLSECVGDDKAHLHENKGFVGWMQRVGILDGKGHLVLE